MTDSHTTRLESALAGRYKIQRKLGEGGMASVYLAEDIKHERKVALKILKPELAAVIGAERFLAEIKTTANLQHPHILPLFDSGEADGFLYYVMPYIDGETLAQKLARERQLGVDEAVRIARDVADALDYAHRNDVLHRDIKPGNILLHDGRPVVADFGIAVAISAAGGGRMTETGLSLGTPHYMSPEQASADRDLSARSDVYSLGCVLYEMLAGQPPHTGPSAQSILVRILTESPRPLTEMRHTVPPHIAAVVMKAIEKLPADRFDTARQFLDALADPGFTYTAAPRAPGTGSATAVASTAAAVKATWLSDTRSRVALAVIAMLVVLGGIATFAGGPTPVPAPVLRTQLSDVDWELRATQDRILISPTGDAFAFLGSVAGGPVALHARRARESDWRMLPGTEGAFRPAFSPDGEWLVYSADDALRKVSLDGGNPATLVAASTGIDPFLPHWGDDGAVVFLGEAGLYEVSENGGEPTLLWEEPRQNLFPPRRLPGGRGVLLGSLPDLGVRLWTPGADSLRTLVPDGKDPTYIPTGHVLYGHPDGGLWAVPFDLDRLETTGPARPVLDGVSGGLLSLYSISDNGTLVYRTGGSAALGRGATSRQLIIVDVETGAVDTLPPAPRGFAAPVFAPDGGRIAFAIQGDFPESDLYTYDFVLGGPTQLTFEPGGELGPVWSPDGTRIAYSSYGAEGFSTADSWVVPVDRSTDPERVLEGDGGQAVADWTPDDVLVYELSTESDTDIRMRPLAQPDADAPFLEAEWYERDPQVSPDGNWLAYTSEETDPAQVFVRRFPDRSSQNRVSENADQFVLEPKWSPDGQTLYYRQGNTVVAARLQLEPSFVVLEREVVFDPGTGFVGFDVHPTEPKLVMAVNAADVGSDGEPEPTRWFVVTNWFDELRARLGEGR